MLVTAVTFYNVILAIHILVVVAAFGVIVAYPVIFLAAERLDPRSAPVLFRVRANISRSLINPGLLLVLFAGIYLAADAHQFKHFYVQFGIAAVIVLGGLEGAFMVRTSKHLAELSQQEIDAAGGGEVKWSDTYVSKRGRSDVVAGLMAVIVLVTVFLMTIQ